MLYYKFVLSNGSEFEMTASEASEMFLELNEMFGGPVAPSEKSTEDLDKQARIKQIERDNEAIKSLNDFSEMRKRISENTELEKLARELEESGKSFQKCSCQGNNFCSRCLPSISYDLRK